jgi:ribosomal protein S18 acetylase RimI-like enzyme
MNIEIKRADYTNTVHGGHIITLMEAYALDPMGGGTPLKDYVKQTLVTELAKHPFFMTLLCYVNGEPAGLINCVEGFSTFAAKPLLNIHDVIVLEAFRGQGLSQLMLQHVEVIAVQRGCCKMTLEVLEGNLSAQHAYVKHGFAAYELNPVMGKALFWQKYL